MEKSFLSLQYNYKLSPPIFVVSLGILNQNPKNYMSLLSFVSTYRPLEAIKLMRR